MAAFNPPWRLDPHLNPKEIFWGGAFVLVQVFAQQGQHKATIRNLRKGSKVLFERSEETGEGYEGIFLISASVPPRDDAIKPGDSTVIFTVDLSGTEPANDAPPPDPDKWVCYAYKVEYTYGVLSRPLFPGSDIIRWIGFRDSFEYSPNGLQHGYIEWGVENNDIDNYHSPASEVALSPPTLWLFDQNATSIAGVVHGGRWINTNSPCTTPPPDEKRLFSMWLWIFPRSKHKLFSSDKYFPIRKQGETTTDTYTWIAKEDRLLDSGSYPINLQVRKFRAFDLTTDHDGDEPLPPKPKAAATDPVVLEEWEKKKKKVEDENQKRFDGRHKLLELWPESFPYKVQQFRYPVAAPPKPAPNSNQPALPSPPPNALVYDVEWSAYPLNGPPPVLQTLNPDT